MPQLTRWPIPAAVTVTLLIQTATGLVWAGKAAARIDTLEARLDAQAQVTERLARVEEQVKGVRSTLDRIERKLP